jgi:hypothetical protein
MTDLFDRELRAHAAGGYSAPGAIYPYEAGFKGDAETGRDAAEAMGPQRGRLQALVIALLQKHGERGSTPEEASIDTGESRVSLQPRFSELKALGRIVDSGQRRVNPSSRKRAVVWVLREFAPVQGEGGGS